MNGDSSINAFKEMLNTMGGKNILVFLLDILVLFRITKNNRLFSILGMQR